MSSPPRRKRLDTPSPSPPRGRHNDEVSRVRKRMDTPSPDRSGGDISDSSTSSSDDSDHKSRRVK